MPYSWTRVDEGEGMKLIDNVGREISSIQNKQSTTLYFECGKIVLEHEEIRGDNAFRDCFFAVQYNAEGIETARVWIGEGNAIFWKEVKNE